MSNEQNKTKHTPGPWHRNIKPARKYSTVFAGRNIHVAVIQSQGLEDDEVEANCDLIAAAPDMLEALRALIDSLPEPVLGHGETLAHQLDYAIRLARNAIAKAEGRE